MTTPTRELHGNAMEGYDPTPTPRSNREWRELAEQAQRDLAAAQQWKEAVVNELIVAHIYTKEHETNPRKAIQDAINWNCQVALDPVVSSDARKLIAAAQERIKSLEEHSEAIARTSAAALRREAAAQSELEREHMAQTNVEMAHAQEKNELREQLVAAQEANAKLRAGVDQLRVSALNADWHTFDQVCKEMKEAS